MNHLNKEGAQKVAGIGVIVAIISGSLLAALMYFGRNLFFSYFAVSGEVEVMARDYYNCFIWFMVITPLYYTFYYLASIDGDDVRIYADLLSGFLHPAISYHSGHGVRGLACCLLLLSATDMFIIAVRREKASMAEVLFRKFLRIIISSGKNWHLSCCLLWRALYLLIVCLHLIQREVWTTAL